MNSLTVTRVEPFDRTLAPVLLSYILSFIYVGIYWNRLQHVKYPSAIGTIS